MEGDAPHVMLHVRQHLTYRSHVIGSDQAGLAHVAFALRGFLGQDMASVCFVTLDFSGAG